MTDTADDLSASARRATRWGLLWILIGILAAIVIVPVLVLGWLGLVPGVSEVMGAREAKDLGVQHSPIDIRHYQSKSGIKFETAERAPEHPKKPGKKKSFDDPKRIEARFTQEELSATLNSASLAWLPVKDIQIRLSDGTIEVSGLLSGEQMSELLRQAARRGVSESDLAWVAAYVERLGGDVPVYVRATGGVQNSQLDLDLQEVAIGRFVLPAEILGRIAPDGIHKTIRASDDFAIDSAVPEDGALVFSGILPTMIYLQQR